MVLLLTTGCFGPDASVALDFDAALEEALRPPPEDAKPDIAVDLSPALIAAMTGAGARELKGGQDFPGATASVSDLVGDVPDCPTCLQMSIRIELPFGNPIEPASSRSLVAVIEKDWTIQTSASVNGEVANIVGRQHESSRLRVSAYGEPRAMRKQVARTVRQDFEAVFGAADTAFTLQLSLPVPLHIDTPCVTRASPTGGLSVACRTATLSPGRVALADPIAEGWRVRIAVPSALASIRTDAFEAFDPEKKPVLLVPRSLTLEGDRATADVRFWSLGESPWWRDAEVEGGLSVADGRIVFDSEQAAWTEASPGAFLADPMLSFKLGELLPVVQRGLAFALPIEEYAAGHADMLTLTPTAIETSTDGSVARVTGSFTTPGQ